MVEETEGSEPERARSTTVPTTRRAAVPTYAFTVILGGQSEWPDFQPNLQNASHRNQRRRLLRFERV
jgi:hypothetical protein